MDFTHDQFWLVWRYVLFVCFVLWLLGNIIGNEKL